jgi:alkaline phosphatase
MIMKTNLNKTSGFLAIAIISVIFISWIPSESSKAKLSPKIKNVIFLIGDGMGVATLYAGMSVSDHPLNIERCPVSGLQKTFSSDNYITDSAGAGTALASGSKTKNGVIGLDAQGKPVKSILEIAKENGLSTGMVVCTTVTDATPASFVAHDASRGNAESIAKDFLSAGIDVFIGGGYKYFGKRSDKVNLIDSLQKKGFEVDTTMSMVTGSNAKKLAGLVYPDQVPYRLKGRGDMLPVASKKALEILSKNKKGFFLMIEGSHIDHGGHDNDQAVLVDEVLDFDQAVGAALDFAEKDGNTLVVVTADHETGGITIVGGNMKDHSVKLNFSSKAHTAVMVPVFAFGPGAEKFTGIYDNTEFIGKFLSSYRFKK